VQLWNLLIEIQPNTLFGWVTNTILGTWLVSICLFVVLYFGTRRRELIPSGLQNALEWVIEALQNLVEGVAGKAKGRKFFPLIATLLLFILFCNMMDVLPIIDTVGTFAPTHGEQYPGFLLWGQYASDITPWFRAPTTDINLTLALAVVSVIAIQVAGFSALGFKKQVTKYFNFPALSKGAFGIVDIFVGLIELISEFGRIISFSFRLFGNVFAGSVLLAVFAFLLPVIPNIIFIPFEMFIGTIQAFVFAFLTLILMTIGSTSHEHPEEGTQETINEYENNEAKAAA
jgi:F-type H+-transporting ATPase subunit a